MKRLLPVLFCLCALTSFAATPALTDFNLTQFSTNNTAGNKVAIKTAPHVTNLVANATGFPTDPINNSNAWVFTNDSAGNPVIMMLCDSNPSIQFKNSLGKGGSIGAQMSHNGLSQPEPNMISDNTLAFGWAQNNLIGPMTQGFRRQNGVGGNHHEYDWWHPEIIPIDAGVRSNMFPSLPVMMFAAWATNRSALVAIGSTIDESQGNSTDNYPTWQAIPFDFYGDGACTLFNNFDISTPDNAHWADYALKRKAIELYVGTNKLAGGFHAYGRGIVDGALTVGPVFDPTNVSGLVLYYDINKQNGLPNGVTTNLIADFSTNHFHLINGTAIYKQSAGSYQSNAFVTLNQTTFQTNFSTTFAGTNTYFMVGQITNSNGVDLDGGSAGDGRNVVFSDGAGGLELFAGTTVDFGVYPSNSGALFVFRTGGNGSILTNMVSIGSPANVGNQGLHGFTVGSKFDGTTAGILNMAALYVYNKDVQGIEYTNICNALNERFRLHAPTDVNPQMIANVPATFNQSVTANGALQSSNSTFIGTSTNSAAFSYSNSWLTATNTRKTNVGQRGTWEVDFTFTDAVGGYPALKVTVEDTTLTNAWTCQIPAGLAATSTNHYCFRVGPNGVVSVTNISTSTATADIVRSRMVWE